MIKKTVLAIGLTLAITHASAQVRMSNITFKTIDGRVIPADKMDSVKKALGPNVQFMHRDTEPGVMYLITQSSVSQKAEEESKMKFAAMIDKPAPYFNVIDLKGKKYNLAALKGKVIVLNFWFIACGGCIAEMPDLNNIKSSYPADQVIFLAFALDKKAPLGKFMKTHDFRYTIIPDAKKTHQTYGVYACPVSMVIDRKGIIRFISDAGERIENKLPGAINTALQTKNK